MESYEEFSKRMEEQFPKMFSGRYGGFAIGAGWYRVIESLCANIQWHIDQHNSRIEWLKNKNGDGETIPEPIEQVVVAQIKEKLGGLRFYYEGGDDTIYGMVRMAESWAASTCEECGERGERRNTSWLATLCDKHYQERLKQK